VQDEEDLMTAELVKRSPMPTFDRARTEFGAARLVCSCKTCVTNCRFLPGHLIPSDLRRLVPAGADLLPWAREHLRASPGTTVLRVYGDGRQELFRIPTLVPVHRDDLSCHWLEDDRCAVHAIAPFACAFFACSQSRSEADALSSAGLAAILAEDDEDAGVYRSVWYALWAEGLQSPEPATKLAAMAAHMGYRT
jgi:hypothetical protein